VIKATGEVLPMQDVYQLTVHFSGHVQGVGFRWTTERIAAGYSVTGRVRNLVDGRVRMYVEGEQAEVEAFVQEVQNVMVDYISDIVTESSTGPQKYERYIMLR